MGDRLFFERKQNFFDRWAPNYDIIVTTPFYQAVHKRMLEYTDFPEDAQRRLAKQSDLPQKLTEQNNFGLGFVS